MSSEWKETVAFVRDAKNDLAERQRKCRLWCAKRLEHFGFLPQVAGEEDFANAVAAYAACCIPANGVRKGICVFGYSGCGKTTFLRAVTARGNLGCVECKLANYHDMKSLDSHVEDDRAFMAHLMRTNVVLDDVGAESCVNDYGVKYDVVTDFVMRYCDEREKQATADGSQATGRLFISTNLTPNQFLERYGGRVLDRVKNLCVALQLNGKSKRKTEFIGFKKLESGKVEKLESGKVEKLESGKVEKLESEKVGK